MGDHHNMDHHNMDYHNINYHNLNYHIMDHQNLEHPNMNHQNLKHPNMDHFNMEHHNMKPPIWSSTVLIAKMFTIPCANIGLNQQLCRIDPEIKCFFEKCAPYENLLNLLAK